MRELAVLFISLALLALEYYLGTRRKPLLGALLAAAWLIGRNKATAAEKAELEKMRAKDL